MDDGTQPTHTPDLPERIDQMSAGTLVDVLGIETLTTSADQVIMRMPVEPRTHQPFGLLHGGATVVLAETVASIGTWLGIDQQRFNAVGIEINCNHLRGVREGWVTAEGLPLHRGRTTWVWDIRVYDDARRLVAVSRCTVAVIPKSAPGV